MELKLQRAKLNNLTACFLLIVPYGIETVTVPAR